MESTETIEHVSGDYGPGRDPRHEWIRGVCPECLQSLVSNCYYTKPGGYKIVWECVGGLPFRKTQECNYRHTL